MQALLAASALPGSTSLRNPFKFRRKFQPALFQALGFVQSHLEPFATIGHLCRGGLAGQLRLQRSALALKRGQALVDLLDLALERAQLLRPLCSGLCSQAALLARVRDGAGRQFKAFLGSSA